MSWVYGKLELLMQSQLDVFCEVLEEVCKTTGDDGNSKFNKVFASIKNLMNDRCATQKKLIICLLNIENKL